MMQPTPVATPAIDPQQLRPQFQQPQQYPQQVISADEIKTLWIGGLQQCMDETYLHNCFASTEGFLDLKINRNKQTGESEGYGFLEFVSYAAAQMALQNYNGLQMPNAEEFYRLNWATFGVEETQDRYYTIYVGNLASDVTGHLLQETFGAIYPSVNGAKTITDSTTGYSKGYGFVRFGDENEQVRAITEMNGKFCSSKPMRIGLATNQTYSNVLASVSDNTNIFVAGLNSTVTEEMLTRAFGQFGELVYVKIPVGKRCGFVQFSNRASAEVALQRLQGTVLGKRPIRLYWGRYPRNKELLSWGSSPANNQAQPAGLVQTQQPDSNQWNGAYYGDGQGYNASNGYGYATQPQDNDPNNTTLFVGGLDSTLTVEILMQVFGQFGELVGVKILVGEGCGIVQFSNRASAEVALQMLQSAVLGKGPIKLDWGRSLANKQAQPAGWIQTQQSDPNQWNDAYYGDQTQQPDPNEWNGAYYGDVHGYNVGYDYDSNKQAQPTWWVQTQQPDPNQWNGAYYDDVQGYNVDYDYGSNKQVQLTGWVQTQQSDLNEWNGAYYDDVQGYNVGYDYGSNKQAQSVEWVQTQQPDPNQWNGAYYGDVQGYHVVYDYAYATQLRDPNMYSYPSPNAND